MDGRRTGCDVWRHRRASGGERRGQSQISVASLRGVSPLLREMPGIGAPRHPVTERFGAHVKRLLTIHGAADDHQVSVTIAPRGEDRGTQVGIFPSDLARLLCSQFLAPEI